MKKLLFFVSLVFVACSESKQPLGGDSTETELPKVWIDSGLPTDGSSLSFIEATVAGNETAEEYQYALFTATDTTCNAAKYGDFRSIDSKIAEINLGDDGMKIICVRGRDVDGNVQKEPKRYSWRKGSAPAVDKPQPHAELSKDPNSDTNYQVKGSEITKKYKFAIIEKQNYNCDAIGTDSSVSYGEERDIEKNNNLVLTTSDGNYLVIATDDGVFTLCLVGLDDDGNEQKTAESYSLTAVEQDTDNNEADVEKPPSPPSPPQLSLPYPHFVWGTKRRKKYITIYSGYSKAFPIVVKNSGGGTLNWKAKSASRSSWLQLQQADASYAPISKSESLASGTLEAEQRAALYFRLSKGRGTSYGKPYKRIYELEFIDTDSGKTIVLEFRLLIPKLDTSKASVKLNWHSQPVRVYADNINNLGSLSIHMIPVFASQLNTKQKKARIATFDQAVKYVRKMIIVNQRTRKYVEFKVVPEKVDECTTYRQDFLIFSNGDSYNASDCDIRARKFYIGGQHGPARWQTRRCKQVAVTLHARADVNNDGKVNVQDMVLVSSHLHKGTVNNSNRRIDVNNDGVIDKADIGVVGACISD